MLNTVQSTRLCLVWQISVVSDVELDVSGTLCPTAFTPVKNSD